MSILHLPGSLCALSLSDARRREGVAAGAPRLLTRNAISPMTSPAAITRPSITMN